jgi:hypothetical protein
MGSSPGPVATVRRPDAALRAGDRPDDRSTRTYDVHGVGLRVSSDIPEALAIVDVTYEAFRVDELTLDVADFALSDLRSGGPCLLQMPRDAARRLSNPHSGTIALLEALVGTIVAGVHRQGVLAVHAGAAAASSGTVVIAGRSGQGKSTLILGLVQRGFGLLSDELALLDPRTGLVHPYPRAIHVRPATIGLIPELVSLADRPRHELGGGSEWSAAPAEIAALLGGRLGVAAPLAAVVLLEGTPDPTAEPRIRQEFPAVAAIELLRSTWAASTGFSATLDAVGGMVATVPCLRLSVGQFDRTVDRLIDHLGVVHD